MPHAALRPLAAIALLAVLAACNSIAAGAAAPGGPQVDDTPMEDPRMIADGSSFTLQPGDTVTLADAGTLRYLRLVNDSRCPPDVQCIWAGDAEIALAWRASDTATVQTLSLHTTLGDKSAAFGPRRLTLLSLARGPAPAAELRIERGD